MVCQKILSQSPRDTQRGSAPTPLGRNGLAIRSTIPGALSSTNGTKNVSPKLVIDKIPFAFVSCYVPSADLRVCIPFFL